MNSTNMLHISMKVKLSANYLILLVNIAYTDEKLISASLISHVNHSIGRSHLTTSKAAP